MLLSYHSSNLLLIALKPMRLILVHISFILKNTQISAIFSHNPLNNLSLIKLVFFTKCKKKAYFIRKSGHACGMDKKGHFSANLWQFDHETHEKMSELSKISKTT